MKQLAGLVSAALLTILLLFSTASTAQSILGRNVSFVVNRQQLDQVLEILSNKANFYFSYNSNIIKGDSLVTLTVYNKTVKQVMEQLFPNGYEYRESGNYIILRKTPIKIPAVTSRTETEEKYYFISGYILDDQTGETIPHASIYEKSQLASAMSDGQGYFKLKLKSRYSRASLTVSKDLYLDTTIAVQPKYNQQMSIAIMPVEVSDKTITITPYTFEVPDSIVVAVRKADSTHWIYTYRKADSAMVDKTNIGRWFLSTWQKVQAINMKKFFTVRPYQLSLLPGLSTNGPLNSQVINNVSLNVWGGYSGGVNGVELGGWFNIDNKDVRWVQFAGWFNVVGGRMTGVQLAGIHNTVMDSVNGVQGSGISNHVRRNFTGAQLGGIYNHVGGRLNGVQAGGIGNYTNSGTTGAQVGGIFNVNSRSFNGAQIAGVVNANFKNMRGAQVAGLLNVNLGEVKGAQIASIINYTKKLSGVQIGLINIADTSDGYSIGLVNIIFKGYHKLALYGNEEFPFNAAFKTGNSKLYSILLAGVEPTKDEKAYTFGYGLGHERKFNRKLALNIEATTQHVYLGSWDYLNLLTRLEAHVHLKLAKWFSIYAGPSVSLYYSDQETKFTGYKQNIRSLDKGKNLAVWSGFTVGMHLF
ncbi:STN and carboxypeptidase regulatory-like domain-containing protein [Paraflavitalea sp. CAU 1676]|uniref:STN and carboxypeptidase regulatory-like domain-containing protein n=1 Tax=Paraflavitalea sp. CAU 1676 TaxID=3032598 RepID=UPI0023DA2E63|nr:STN and carboxypeptidase regulatory-like domain-containing protein [Paraflavitalea sp. CAU 1676]MDF2192271.1 STN and carboxypeptidase regulatory-like domain-containing protein [Paraflavitalea sp. CAU 1676]